MGNTSIKSSAGLLNDYQRIFAGYSKKWLGPVASIDFMKNKTVKGTIAWLTMEEIHKLDVFEGCKSDDPMSEKNVYRR